MGTTASERLQLILEASVRGTEEVAKLAANVAKFDRSISDAGATSKKVGGDFDGFADKLKNAIQNPLRAAGEAAEGFAKSLGPIGVAVGGIGAVAVAAGVGIYSLAKSFGELYEQQNNNAIRLGVSIREYGLLAQVSSEAGLEADALVGTMRGLSKALSDNSTEGVGAKVALRELGITATNAFGAVRPMTPLLLEIADKLGAINSPAERAGKAIEILGRSGMNVLPVMNSDLREQVEALEKAGYGWTKYGVEVAKATDAATDAFSRQMGEAMKWAKGGAAQVFQLFNEDPKFAAFVAKQRAENDAKVKAMLTDERISMSGGSLAGSLSAAQLTPFGGPSGAGITDFDAMAKHLKDKTAAAVVSAAKAAEAAAKIAEAARQAAEAAGIFTARGLKDPIRINSLLRPGESTSQMLGTFGATNRPSLLRAGESAYSGMMGIDPIAIQNRLTQSQSATDFAARKVEVSAFPGYELQAATTAAGIRLAGLEKAKTLGMDIFQADMDRNRILEDLELSRLSIQRQRLSELKQEGGSMFDALTAGGAGVGDYVKGLALGQVRTTFSNVYSMGMSEMSGKLSLTNNPGSTMGKIFAGTMFGADPMKTATDANTMATVANTTALNNLSVGGSGGGGIGKAAAGIPWLSGLGMADSVDAASLTRMGLMTPADIYGGGTAAVAKGGGLSVAKIGSYAALGAAGYGIYQGASQGGLSGGLTAGASAAGMVAMLPTIMPAIAKALPMLGPIGAIASMGLGLVTAFLPNPKQKRAAEIEAEGRSRYSEMPTGESYSADIYGRKTDYNKRGETRVYINLSAIDSKSGTEFLITNSDTIGEVIRQGVQGGYPPLTQAVQSVAYGM